MSTLADWHANQAMRWYTKGNMTLYKRHIGVADTLRAKEGEESKAKMSRLQNAFPHRR